MQPFNNNTFLKYTVDNPIQTQLQSTVQNTIGKQLQANGQQNQPVQEQPVEQGGWNKVGNGL